MRSDKHDYQYDDVLIALVIVAWRPQRIIHRLREMPVAGPRRGKNANEALRVVNKRAHKNAPCMALSGGKGFKEDVHGGSETGVYTQTK